MINRNQFNILFFACLITIQFAIYEGATIKLVHNGLYVARFFISWKENGEDLYFYKNNQELTAPFNEEINISDTATNLNIKASVFTGLLWERWPIIFDKQNIPIIKEREFIIGGTSLKPNYKINPELI